ncbi:glycosyltransferase family 4 protein [Sphingobacterium alkalisoli]|uniref:Glycosyltransferase family 4 protein n=1 Tax=Sphingobacterium alkalisoli TaxID=1874115 RepID=A0A4U0GYD9_9SPHI|nr:glycosyltransferase [Sphingobacterium alkalisoli]TJY64225.1 glycosyltransferase family 4 protein [Sphingobacterium alkalisoli]GGH23073.1 glycosyl transferase [Sphingobacterium alkalisoli]
MKILLVQHESFINGSGGTERICCFLANGFVTFGWQVEIATNENIEGDPIFPLDERVVVTNIYDKTAIQKKIKPLINYRGKNPLLWIKYKLRKKYAKLFNKVRYVRYGGKDGLHEFNLSHRSEVWKSYLDHTRPDLIVTMTISSVLELTYKNNINIPIINSTNGRPDHDYTDVLWYRSELEMSLLKDAFKNLAGIQVLFDSYQDFLPPTFNGISRTIPNPILDMGDTNVVDHLEEKDRYKILHLGRLVGSHKQQHIAIEAFGEIAHKYPDWDLEFWGEGEDYAVLFQKIKDANLENRIFLKGFTDQPSQVLQQGDIFIFPSRHEGFPLALAEAMYVGLPSVGLTDCCGVNEMIEHGKNGFLAADLAEMRSHLEMMVQDSGLRQRMGMNAHFAIRKHTPEHILSQWNELIQTVTRS